MIAHILEYLAAAAQMGLWIAILAGCFRVVVGMLEGAKDNVDGTILLLSLVAFVFIGILFSGPIIREFIPYP